MFSWALQHASQEVVDRYNAHGRKMTFRDDIIAETGSQWVNSPLRYTYTIDGEVVVSISPFFDGMSGAIVVLPGRKETPKG